MKSKILTVILIIVLILFAINTVSMFAGIKNTEKEIKEIEAKIREQKIINAEYSAILQDENIEDFYVSIAESELDFAYSDEILFIDVSGQ